MENMRLLPNRGSMSFGAMGTNELKFLTYADSLFNMIEKGRSSQKMDSVTRLYWSLQHLLNGFDGNPDLVRDLSRQNFDHLSVFYQYQFMDKAIGAISEQAKGECSDIANGLYNAAKPKLLSWAESTNFSTVKIVPGPLSDPDLLTRGIENIIIISTPSESYSRNQDIIKYAEKFRKANNYNNAALYCCNEPERELKRLNRNRLKVAYLPQL